MLEAIFIGMVAAIALIALAGVHRAAVTKACLGRLSKTISVRHSTIQDDSYPQASSIAFSRRTQTDLRVALPCA